jgi:predicted MPP superfamily phosphohydrolase
MNKILHLSDLHFCSSDIVPKIQRLFDAVEKKTGQKFDIEFADQGKLDCIKSAVDELNPDIICITGDITTFGDKKSFSEAESYLKELKNRPKPYRSRKIVVTPGNHDILCSQIKALLNKKGILAQSLKWWARECNKMAEELLGSSEINANIIDPLENFRTFISGTQCSNGNESVGEVNGATIWCMPFDSVSLDPLWINIGEASNSKFHCFNERLKNIPQSENALIITLLHHNPISSPEICEPKLINAYNSFPGASLFTKEMQDAGVDIILYGHQHKTACYQMDFVPSKPGHLYLIGSSSSTSGSESGFSFLRVEDRFCAYLQKYKVKGTGSIAEEGEEEFLVFEKNSIQDSITKSAQREIRHYRGKQDGSDELEWDKMFHIAEGDTEIKQDLLVIGPASRRLKNANRLKSFTKMLETNKSNSIRILITDPKLFDIIKNLPSESDRKTLSEMWGTDKHTWQGLSSKAEITLGILQEFKERLDDSVKKRLHIKVSHTFLPIAAALRYRKEQPDSILLWMLPVGLLGDLDKAILRLSPRCHEASFAFYLDYIEKLWAVGTEL